MGRALDVEERCETGGEESVDETEGEGKATAAERGRAAVTTVLVVSTSEAVSTEADS